MKTTLQCKLLSLLLIILSVSLFFTSAVAGGLKDRMKARLPAINQLKAAGVVGENNVGLLDFKSADRSQAATVDAENADRQKVYSAIGQQQKASASFVGKKRAEQIAAKASPGTWLQDAGGNWYRK